MGDRDDVSGDAVAKTMFEGIDDIKPAFSNEQVFGANGYLEKCLDGYEPRPSQIQLSGAIGHVFGEQRHLVAEAPTGCHVAGQGILMFDGSIKKVEDVIVGDQLMGPDSEPRNVVILARGEEDIVEVVPVKGDPWRVNRSHVLTLQRVRQRSESSGRKDSRAGEIIDVVVSDWLKWSKTQKHIHKLFRVGVEFSGTQKHVLSPYHLGVLIGDGSLTNSVGVTKGDDEIRQVANEIAGQFGLRVRVDNSGSVPTYYIVRQNGGRSPNPLIEELRHLGLYGCKSEDKFVPNAYKVAGAIARAELLAGLMDTDGHLTCGGYDYVSASKILADDVAFVARSIGLAAYVSESVKSWQNGTGIYYRVSISGDLSIVPCKIDRKKAPRRKQIKSVLRTGFSIKELGYKDKYYGFMLDGDGRYLLDDFTVTHNTGKSIAYLAPSIAVSAGGGPKTVIATANIALQEQLAKKDLPFLQEALPVDFKFALVKGKNNYLCLDSMEATKQAKFGFNFHGNQESELLKWAATTETGDKSELSFEPDPQLWSAFSATAEECLGKACPHRENCFADQAKGQMEDADVIVCNYHLLFAHVKVKMETSKDLVLPEFSFLVCDEGHKIADVARSFFGWTLSEYVLNRLAKQFRDLTNAALAADELNPNQEAEFSNLESRVVDINKQIWLEARNFHGESRGPNRVRKTGSFSGNELSGAVGEMGGRFRDLGKLGNATDKVKEKCKQASKRCRDIAKQAMELDTLSDEEGVYFTERSGKKNMLRITKRLVDVSKDLWNSLFQHTASTIITSATLAVNGSCYYVRKEIGMREAQELVVGSPFNHKEQALFVLSPRAPDPQQKDHTERVCKVLEFVIGEANGRTLGLFTSYRALNMAKEYLEKADLGHTLLYQGQKPRNLLIEEFKRDTNSVLLGTESLWQGVDIPGEALSCLVIDKIPFKSPGDPVWESLCERAGDQWFFRLAVPAATIQLKQGVGRLIRTVNDKGVCIILDRRLITKNYGKTLINSLPNMSRTNTLKGSIRGFLDNEEG